MLNEGGLRLLPRLEPIEARFWSKVDIVDDDASCWPWQRFCNDDGYGMFTWRDAPEPRLAGKAVGAHRIAFYLINGFSPEHTCHTCDNPPCCRPGHLFDGTALVNIADRHSKGRSRGAPGVANSGAKVTDAQVLAIRERAHDGEPHRVLAATYGLSETAITMMVTGRTWSHLGGPDHRLHGARTPLDEGQVLEIRYRAATGSRGIQSALAAEYGVDKGTISNIVKGKVWKHLLPQ